MDHCEQCGFAYDLAGAASAASSIMAGVWEFATLLRASEADVCTRGKPDRWSALEYGCHLRDVLLVQRERVLAARRQDRPTNTPMGREERVEHDGYADQDPTDVAQQLTVVAQLFTNVLDRLGPQDWQRTLIYNYPSSAERTLRWVAVHTLHEVQHHLRDAREQ